MQICEFFIYLKSTFLVCLSCCAALIKQSQIKLIYCQWLNFTALQRRLNFRKLICFSDIFSYTFKIVKKTNKQTKGKEKKTVNPLMLIMLLPLFLSLSFLDESKALQSERGKKDATRTGIENNWTVYLVFYEIFCAICNCLCRQFFSSDTVKKENPQG